MSEVSKRTANLIQREIVLPASRSLAPGKPAPVFLFIEPFTPPADGPHAALQRWLDEQMSIACGLTQ